MSATEDTKPSYPPPSNPVFNVVRAACAYGLLGVQLAFFLFVLELPYWIADRFSKHRGDAFYRGQRRIGKWFFRLYPFGQQRRINVNRAAFPEPCVIVCNHQSTLDILMALLLPVNARWMIKGWPFKYPMMGELNRLCRHIQIDDSDADPDRPKGYDTALDWLKQGVSILVFPEGSRSPDGEIHRFKNGAFLLAVDAQVPIVPVLFEGTGACVRKGSPAVSHPDTLMKVLPAVSTNGLEGAKDAAELKQTIRAQLKEELRQLRGAKRRPGYPRVQGWITRLAMACVALVLALGVGTSIYVNNWCIAEPPEYDGDKSLAEKNEDGSYRIPITQKTMGGETVSLLGEEYRWWRRDSDGIHEIGLSGSPWERGCANARLSQDLVKEQEELLVDTAEDFFSNDIALWAAKQALAINNRRLPEYVTDAEKLEVLGLTEGSVNHYPDEAPLYHRILNYHAAHDISHMFIDNPLVTTSEFSGCTAFAAWGEASANGDMIVGRNFDFEAGDVFDRHKAVIYVWPDDGIPYVHVAWAGMAGAVTGMNKAGLSIHINAARTSEVGFGRIGTPVSILVRRVLEGANNIEEAFAIIEQTDVFVSDTYMVASRADGRAVVIEKSPDHCAMREAGREGLILQTNHMLTEPLKDDETNVEAMERATTLYRWERAKELTDEHYGELDRDVALEILRDRKGRGGKDIGLGNRNAIAAGICAHSVIMNVTTGEMWVSTAPHTFGRYLHIDVSRALSADSSAPLRIRRSAQKNLPRSMEYTRAEDLDEFRRQVRFMRGAIDEEDLKEAEALARTLRNVNPKSFETSYWQGRLAYLKEDYTKAASKFEEAMEREPHYEAIREDIRHWLQKSKDQE